MRELPLTEQITRVFESESINRIAQKTGLPTSTISKRRNGGHVIITEDLVENLRDLGYALKLIKLEG